VLPASVPQARERVDRDVPQPTRARYDPRPPQAGPLVEVGDAHPGSLPPDHVSTSPVLHVQSLLSSWHSSGLRSPERHLRSCGVWRHPEGDAAGGSGTTPASVLDASSRPESLHITSSSWALPKPAYELCSGAAVSWTGVTLQVSRASVWPRLSSASPPPPRGALSAGGYTRGSPGSVTASGLRRTTSSLGCGDAAREGVAARRADELPVVTARNPNRVDRTEGP
jgi:hypothetical protein